jgi:hypothetical protein
MAQVHSTCTAPPPHPLRGPDPFAVPCEGVRDVPGHGVAQPHLRAARPNRDEAVRGRVGRRGVAVQVEFEKANFVKPGFHFIGARVEARRFQALRAN